MWSRRARRERNCDMTRARARYMRAVTVVASVTGLAEDDITGRQHGSRPRRPRSSPIGFARLVTIYLAVVALDARRSALARTLGRPRKAVSDACRVIEDARDRPAIDDLLTRLEAML